jgi:hypothetical protein
MKRTDVAEIDRLVENDRLVEAGRYFLDKSRSGEVSDHVRVWLRSVKALEASFLAGDFDARANMDERTKLARRFLTLVRAHQQSVAAQPVFISYNHRDALTAHALSTCLESNGVPVVIDTKSAGAGQPIGEFIASSIAATRATVLVISEASLLSSWVGSESRLALAARELHAARHLIACYLDDEFLSPAFRLKLTAAIDERIAQIDALVDEGKKHGIDSRELWPERARLDDLRHSLGAILDALRATLCLDVRSEQLAGSCTKLIAALSGDAP